MNSYLKHLAARRTLRAAWRVGEPTLKLAVKGGWRPGLIGACAGLAIFLVETLLILRRGAAGLNIEVEGPFAALFSAAKPQLAPLLVRVAVAYAVAGLVLGIASAALATLVSPPKNRWRHWVAGEWVALAALLLWDRAIARPALFDDLPALRPFLSWLVDHGRPWQPRLAAGLWGGFHLLAAARRVSPQRLLPVGIGAAAIGTLWLGPSWRPAPAVKHPLVVLFGIDAFRPDRLKVYGGSGRVAPNLEKFVESATLFDRAFTPIAQTEPGWRSLVTARWPHRHGDRYPLTAEARWEPAPTFPAELSTAGYQTTFVTDCSRFNYQGPLSGFSDRRQPPRGAINFVLEKLRYRALGVFADNALGASWLPEFIDNRALAGIHDPISYADRLARSVVRQAESGPLLFAFHATAAHFPGDPVYPFYRQFVASSEPMDRRIRMSFAPITGSSDGAWTREGSEALYDELLAQADTQLGILLDALKRNGLYDDALIVVFSDHGESFHADSPWLAGSTPVHGARLTEEENRILLAIKLPVGMPAPRPRRIEALVRLVDIGPTLLDLQGMPPLPGSDGQSLVPLLKGQSMPPLRLYAETGFTHARPDAFDPGHLSSAPRTLDAYRIRPDGTVELSEEAHQAVIREKDIGTFDGFRWIIRSPRKDGTVALRCLGECSQQGEAVAWLEEVQ